MKKEVKDLRKMVNGLKLGKPLCVEVRSEAGKHLADMTLERLAGGQVSMNVNLVMAYEDMNPEEKDIIDKLCKSPE